MTTMNFTKSAIDKLPLPTQSEIQAVYYDTKIQGLALRVSYGGTKTYFVEGRLNGRKRKINIGKHGIFVPDEAAKDGSARIRAKQILAELTNGVNHNAVKAEKRARATTLRIVFEQFKQARKLKKTTERIYTSSMTRCFSDWLDKPITDISKDMIEQRYHKLLNTVWERGTSGIAQAHQAMRTLRAVLNYASAVYEDEQGKSILPENPVRRLTQARIWRPVDIRENIIKPTQLKDWYKAVMKLNNDAMCDYLLLVLFTGLRRNEAAKLCWKDIDFDAKTLKIPAENSKNGLEHRLPLTTFLCDLLQDRKEANSQKKLRKLNNDFVFPGDGVTGHIIETKRSTTKVVAVSGVKFMIHDLRRTFLTIAEMLDIPHYALKKLANHKTTDITGRYIQADTERLREPMQKITNFLVDKTGAKRTPRTTGKTIIAFRAG